MADDCHGSTHNVDIKKGLYEGNGLYLCENKQAKAQHILDFLKGIGIDPKKCCTGTGCEDKTEKCLPGSVKLSGKNADLGIAEVKLHDKQYCKYMIDATADTTVTITVGCACIPEK